MAPVANDIPTALRLEGKVAIVTGGASGIGEAAVKTFVANGAKVIVADIQDTLGEKVAREVGGPEVARYIHCDVSKEEHVAAAVDFTVKTFGGLDVMFNNAGIVGPYGPIDQISVEGFDHCFGVILRGAFLGMKHAARVMKPAQKGSIITTSSVAGHQGGIGGHSYTAFKHALTGLTCSTATELRQFNIRVNNISPGAVQTPIWSTRLKFKKLEEQYMMKEECSKKGVARLYCEPQSIADAALFLASDESGYVSGHCLVVDGSHYLHPLGLRLTDPSIHEPQMQRLTL